MFYNNIFQELDNNKKCLIYFKDSNCLIASIELDNKYIFNHVLRNSIKQVDKNYLIDWFKLIREDLVTIIYTSK